MRVIIDFIRSIIEKVTAFDLFAWIRKRRRGLFYSFVVVQIVILGIAVFAPELGHSDGRKGFIREFLERRPPAQIHETVLSKLQEGDSAVVPLNFFNDLVIKPRKGFRAPPQRSVAYPMNISREEVRFLIRNRRTDRSVIIRARDGQAWERSREFDRDRTSPECITEDRVYFDREPEKSLLEVSLGKTITVTELPPHPVEEEVDGCRFDGKNLYLFTTRGDEESPEIESLVYLYDRERETWNLLQSHSISIEDYDGFSSVHQVLPDTFLYRMLSFRRESWIWIKKNGQDSTRGIRLQNPGVRRINKDLVMVVESRRDTGRQRQRAFLFDSEKMTEDSFLFRGELVSTFWVNDRLVFAEQVENQIIVSRPAELTRKRSSESISFDLKQGENLIDAIAIGPSLYFQIGKRRHERSLFVCERSWVQPEKRTLLNGFQKCDLKQIPVPEYLASNWKMRSIDGELYIVSVAGVVARYGENESWDLIFHYVDWTAWLNSSDLDFSYRLRAQGIFGLIFLLLLNGILFLYIRQTFAGEHGTVDHSISGNGEDQEASLDPGVNTGDVTTQVDQNAGPPSITVPASTGGTRVVGDRISALTLEETRKAMSRVARDSYLLLAGGILTAVAGLAIFFQILPEDNLRLYTLGEDGGPKKFKHILEIFLEYYARPTSMLIFIELIAMYLLKMYGVLFHEYKHFFNIYLERANLRSVLHLMEHSKELQESSREKLLESLLKERTQPKQEEQIFSGIERSFMKIITLLIRKIPGK